MRHGIAWLSRASPRSAGESAAGDGAPDPLADLDEETPTTHSDDNQDDPTYDLAMVPDDRTEQIEVEFNAQTPVDP
jgi:hypothetical protein